jgi:hypothetical protein
VGFLAPCPTDVQLEATMRWFLIQSAIILLVVNWLHGKTPNKVVPGFLGVAAAFIVTWLWFHRPWRRR